MALKRELAARAQQKAKTNSKGSRQQQRQQQQDKEPTYLYIQKYTTGISPAEAILIGGIQPWLLQIVDGKAVLSKEIPLPSSDDDDTNIILRPLPKWSYI